MEGRDTGQDEAWEQEPFAMDLKGDPGRRGWFGGSVTIVAALVLLLLAGFYLYSSDANADRWELRCARGQAEARRGIYFPWGTRRIADDAHDALSLPEGVSCATVSLTSLEELDATLGALLLEAAEHRLQQGGPEALAQARRDVERARRLQGLTVEQRQRAEALVADMAYHEAREILRQVERNLWQARRRLENARALGAGERMGDLEEWLAFVEAETERFRPGSRAAGREGAARHEASTDDAVPVPAPPAHDGKRPDVTPPQDTLL